MERVRVALDTDGSVSNDQIAAFATRHHLEVDADLGRIDQQIGVLEIREGTAVVILPIGEEADDHEPSLAAAVARRADELGAVGLLGAGGLALAPALGVGVASAYIANRARERQAKQRRLAGKRRGPLPHKPPRELLERIVDRLDNAVSYQAIADELRANGVKTPTGSSNWYAATVKRLIDSSLNETKVVLGRLGGMLAEIDAAKRVTEPELKDLGFRHGFHHHRLLKAFEAGWSRPHLTDFVPPIEREGEYFVLSDGGRRLLEIWERSSQLDDHLEDLLLQVLRSGNRGLSPAQYENACRGSGIELSDVPSSLVSFDPETVMFRLTAEGTAAAETWGSVVDRDPRKRLDIDFWPEIHEDTPPWDWDEDPLELAAREGGAAGP